MWKRKDTKSQQQQQKRVAGNMMALAPPRVRSDGVDTQCEETSMNYHNQEVEYLTYHRGMYIIPSTHTDDYLKTLVQASIQTNFISDCLTTFVESFDITATVKICNTNVSSDITVYRKQFLYNVPVRLETNVDYHAVTGLNIPVWVMRGYKTDPQDILDEPSTTQLTVKEQLSQPQYTTVSVDPSKLAVVRDDGPTAGSNVLDVIRIRKDAITITSDDTAAP